MEAESLTPEGDVLGAQQERGQHLVAVIFLLVRIRLQGERMEPIVRRIFYFLFCESELQKNLILKTPLPPQINLEIFLCKLWKKLPEHLPALYLGEADQAPVSPVRQLHQPHDDLLQHLTALTELLQG